MPQTSKPERPGRTRARRPAPFTPAQVAARLASVPALHYPEELPVSQRRPDIAEALKSSQVVIVSGETGSGKTTQLPKICLELGRGIKGMIGHTQPRRIAARAVAERIADELGCELGGVVGYQVRFTDAVSEGTLIKLMTDGILLAEIQRDPLLRHYDTIIIDEAHERSLNIDFLLGYLTQLLPRRPDLLVVITSATIDSERFAAHFGPAIGKERAPVVEVSGRTYPVEIRYRPLVPEVEAPAGAAVGGPHSFESREGGARSGRPPAGTAVGVSAGGPPTGRPEPLDPFTAICLAADELLREGPGDILVFLSGEREIRDAQAALIEHLGTRYVADGTRAAPSKIEIVPLYARLAASEQARVFKAHTARRIVLATNVAETSLTVPGIRYVIDPGTARISRYSTRTKVQRLPIEPISQASANQRSGRCGRLADGVAIRLYSRTDFEGRAPFTEPEILRTSLASVILQMAAAGLGEVERFPFVDPPDSRSIRDGLAQLFEIGAIESQRAAPELTPVGRKLARLPVDPRLGRMLLEAEENGCASQALVIVAALSVQDVRERPAGSEARADQLHRRFTDPESDFLAYLNIWTYLRIRQRELSGSAFRRTVRAEHLHYLRYREWQDVVGQLRQLARPLGLNLHPLPLPAGPLPEDPSELAGAVAAHVRSQVPAAQLHRSLLVGLLTNIGTWNEKRREYDGARGTKFTVWPGSGLAKKRHEWVMAAELVETGRLFARTVGAVKPEWAEAAAPHLVKRTHSDPFWSAREARALVREKVTLYGLPLAADRAVPLASLPDGAREAARDMFIARALVGGEWRGRHRFLERNRELLAEAADREARLRQRGLAPDEDAQFTFYDERLPAGIVSGRHFDAWWRRERAERPELLTFTPEFLAGGTPDDSFPTTWTQGDITLRLSYVFEPGAAEDGITCHVPVSLLARLDPAGFDWLVPGLLPELAVATIRALPKRVRVGLVPAPDVAREILADLTWQEGGEDWIVAFTRAARRVRDVEVEGFDPENLPKHLRMRFQVESERGAVLGRSPSLLALQRRFAGEARAAVRNVVRGAVQAARNTPTGQVPGTRSAPASPDSHSPSGGNSPASLAGSVPAGSVPASSPHRAPASFAETPDLTDFPAAGIPASLSAQGAGGFEVRGYPALVARGSAVDLRVLPSALEQATAHASGVRMLALNQVRLGTERVTTRWSGADALTLATSPYPSTAALVADCQLAAAGNLAAAWGHPLELVRTPEQFGSLVVALRAGLEEEVFRVVGLVVQTLAASRETERALKASSSLAILDTLREVREQVDGLLGPGFVSRTPGEFLPHLPRYLAAARLRVERALRSPRADATAAWRVNTVEGEWQLACEAQRSLAPDRARERNLETVRWLIEELRVSLFAQQLGTSKKVSEARIRKLLES